MPLRSALLLLLLPLNQASAQGLGPVTGVDSAASTLTIHVSDGLVVLRACTPTLLMVNYRPSGIEDADTLVVARTSWPDIHPYMTPVGSPIRIVTPRFSVEIDRFPFRIHFRSAAGSLLCEEPPGGGLSKDSVLFSTSGGTFYGVGNRSQGNLDCGTGGLVYAGVQGHAGGPFAWTTNGWGFLADADGGAFQIAGNTLAFSRPPNPVKRDIEMYFAVGSPAEIFSALHEVSGAAPLFPRYTLGYMNTEWGIDQAELYSDIATYRSKRIPIDAYILDFDWMDWGSDNYGEFRWGSAFPDGQSGAIMDTLVSRHMHLMGIRKPRVHVATSQGAYAQAHGFFLGTTTDYFSGKLVGTLDFQSPAVRDWYWNSFATRCGTYAKGITGYWNDEADAYGGNLMFLQMERAQYEGQRRMNDRRVWSLNRNFYTGAQRYAYGLWSGDIQTSWSTMADQRLFMLSSIAVGASWWGMDIGGFSGTPSAELYLRWMQFGAFVPVFRVHGTRYQEREPWHYGAEAESLATQAIRFRYRLLPYIAAAAWTNHLTGLPLVRPLVMDYPADPAVANRSDEWTFGPSLLISPVVTQGETSHAIYLPTGVWVEMKSGLVQSGPVTLTLPITHADVPVFVKGGSILPMAPALQYAEDSAGHGTFILVSYPRGMDSCSFLQDDGASYAYETGALSRTDVRHTRGDRQASVEIAVCSGPYRDTFRTFRVEFPWVAALPDSVLLDGIVVKRVFSPGTLSTWWQYDTTAQECDVEWPYDAAAHTLRVFFSPSESDRSGGSLLPQEYHLDQNYPNPFNPSTHISYDLPCRSDVQMSVSDLQGRLVAQLVSGSQDAGRYEYSWKPQEATGIYFLRIDAKATDGSGRRFNNVRKMVLVK